MILGALHDAADRGVHIRLLVDGMESWIDMEGNPVSYTHLDVYKRQEGGGSRGHRNDWSEYQKMQKRKKDASGRFGTESECEFKLYQCCRETVSYTHLDVYKRQVEQGVLPSPVFPTMTRQR